MPNGTHELRPIEGWSWIGFSARRDITVTGNPGKRWVGCAQGLAKVREHGVLGRLKGFMIRALAFNADGEVVAAASPLKFREPRMPGTVTGADKLDQLASASDQKMG